MSPLGYLLFCLCQPQDVGVPGNYTTFCLVSLVWYEICPLSRLITTSYSRRYDVEVIDYRQVLRAQ